MGWFCDVGPRLTNEPRRTREEMLEDFLRRSVVIELRPLPSGELRDLDPTGHRYGPQDPKRQPDLP
jgi:hypothetical protein